MLMRSKWATLLAGVAVISAAALIACGGGSNKSESPTQAPAATATRAPATTAPPTTAPAASPTTQAAAGAGGASLAVSIADFNFSPAALTARVGQAITLNVSNGGQFPHTFTITGVADSGTLSAGTSKPVTFTPSQAGTLTFFCMIHGQATMSGTITVSASGSLGPAPGTGGGVTTSSSAGPVPTVSGYDYGY